MLSREREREREVIQVELSIWLCECMSDLESESYLNIDLSTHFVSSEIEKERK